MTKANLKQLEEGKLYYSISEVCAMTGLEQHVLRYWESEFPQLRPKKNRSGNRAYRAKEIKIVRYIKYLLYEEKYTIPGAKKKMAEANKTDLDGQLSLLKIGVVLPQESASEGEEERVPRKKCGEKSSEKVSEKSGDGEAQALRAELIRVKKELRELLEMLKKTGK